MMASLREIVDLYRVWDTDRSRSLDSIAKNAAAFLQVHSAGSLLNSFSAVWHDFFGFDFF
jgi:hypothetical protein